MKVEVITGRLTKATGRSAAYDIYAAKAVTIYPQHYAVIPTGLKVRMTGCYALCVDRSGLAAKKGVSRRAGLIDEDYEGEWFVIVHNEGDEPFEVTEGMRIAQTLFMPMVEVEVVGEGVQELGVVRGEGGLGSTGVQ